MEPLGAKIRKRRRRLGLTLDELAGRAAISKPYLSLIETGRATNPPSDEKLARLEQTLGFNSGELLAQAHLQRTPGDVRAVLGKLLTRDKSIAGTGDLEGALLQLVDQSAGIAVPVGQPGKAADEYVHGPQLSDKDAFAARVQGDAMLPKYRQGDIVIFSPAASPRSGDDCFVRFGDGQTTFKRIFFETDGPGQIPVVRLQPRNEKYRPTVLKREQVCGLYRAVYQCQRVDEE
jgi:SOS-response transcriptional repressor LexA